LASLMAQVILTVVVGAVLYREGISAKHVTGFAKVELRSSVLAVLALGGFWVLGSEDTVLARHYLPAHSAGIYAAAATAGRIALFLPGAIATIAFPQFSVERGRSEVARRALRWSLAATAVIGLLGAVVLVVAPSLVIELLFGSKYLAGVGALRLLALEAGMLGVVSLLVFFHLARQSLQSLVPWIGAAVGVVGIALFHGSPLAIAASMVTSVGLVALLMLLGAGNAVLREPLAPAVQVITPRGDESCGPMDGVDLSIVVPFYNPGALLASHLQAIEEVLLGSGLSFEVIAVSDGSTDGSTLSVLGSNPDIVHVYELARNCGKGHALRVGLSQAHGRYVGFIDADGDIPAGQLITCIDAIKAGNADIVTGSKRHPGSSVYYPLIRRVYSWGYQQFIWGLFRLSVRDTQTGIKVIRREVLEKVLPLTVEKRFAFDLELFVVARRLGFDRIVEVPVTINRRFTSTVSLRAVRGMVLDTLGIFYRLRVLHYYDRRVIEVAGVVAGKGSEV